MTGAESFYVGKEFKYGTIALSEFTLEQQAL
jgi:hypothetical protein